MNSNDEESTLTSETTPLHANTTNRNQQTSDNRRLSFPPSRFASSNTVNSSLTATTYESSSATLNDTLASVKVYDASYDVSKNISLQEIDQNQPSNSRVKTTATIFILTVGLLVCLVTLLQYPIGVLTGGKENETSTGTHTKLFEPDSKQYKSNQEMFDELGRYIIEDYDSLPPFSDFLPGVAGIYGKPLWSFYVNRGQGITSFGVESKDSPIMEFHSANNAYQNTALLGFRTFYKFNRGGGWGSKTKSFVIEPFSTTGTQFDKELSEESKPEKEDAPIRTMFIGANELQLREVDQKHNIETNVTFFVLPEEDFGAFVKRTTVSNLGASKLHISILDGMPRIQPVGGKIDGLLKTMGRTLEGFMGVYEADGNTMPFYRLSTEPGDTAAVVIEEEGNFVLSYMENEEQRLLPIVYDTSKLFGQDTSLMWPYKLEYTTVKDIINGDQYGAAKTSSAFAAIDKTTIHPGESVTISTFYGKAKKITDVPVVARRISQGGFAQYKLSRARELIQQITSGVETSTHNKLFDAHIQQMYLDNSLRGGIPIILGEVDDDSRSANADDDNRLKVYHLFSRIHGDLERDYNDFVLSSTYFSQGPGNFRDIAQNRRNDIIINPRIGSHNVKMFLSLIQADGYNPLSVEAIVFTINDVNECIRLAAMAVGEADGHRKQREALADILCDGEWRPGQLASMIEEQNVFLLMSFQDFINEVTASSEISPMAVSKEGFWADHWTYLMDLVYSYVKIYPDQEERLLFDERVPCFFSPRVVQPRRKKYVLSKTLDGKAYHVRQLEASREDKNRLSEMKKYRNNSSGWFDVEANYEHDGDGNIILSSSIEKLFLLGTLKFATIDPLGMGIEYEGGKPGWNDAMNGLVGMIGSGMSETFELKDLLTFIQQASFKYQRPIFISEELASLVEEISAALDALNETDIESIDFSTISKVPEDLFKYWDKVASARETYRHQITSLSGQTKEYSHTMIIHTVSRWLVQIDHGIQRSQIVGTENANMNDNKLNIPPTYFSYNVTRWILTGEKDTQGHSYVNATEMAVNKFPLFLEGAVRSMKTVDLASAKKIFDSVKVSGLYDTDLGMFTLSSSLAGQNPSMGRMMAFTPGWLENQSVWLHMSYKLYLELLKKGMYTQFFDEMQSGMLPFIHSETYGRSPVECSSFIASSAFVDPSIRGRGYLARLSGSTAEFLSMWALMMIGPTPFFINTETKLVEMQLTPVLPSWLFQEDVDALTPEHKYYIEFMLFTSIKVVYFVPKPQDLFGMSPRKYKVGLRDGSIVNIDGPTIPNDVALRVRRVVFVDHIHVHF